MSGVQPEAVAYMQRAVRVVSNRLIASATLGAPSAEGLASTADGTAPERKITAEDVHDAIRLPAPAPWMAPPCQRAGSQPSAFNKFVA